MNISQNILLTGAGFSHNFGGFLADGMWSQIFNHTEIQTRQTIKNTLLKDFDYESIYNEILLGPADKWFDSDRASIRVAVLEAYRQLDQFILNYNKHPNIDYMYAVNKFIERFSGDMRTIGFFFTLNQDIFVERFYNSSNKPLVLPRMRRVPDYSSDYERKSILQENDFITVVRGKDTDWKPADKLSKQELHYIKLHGSFNWKSSDGSNMMVIGKDKEHQISREPLLAWYVDIFKQVLSQKERRLLIIGYGFRDKHINQIIATAIKENGLKLYVVSPEGPRDFIEKLEFGETLDRPFGPDILKGLSGYFPYKLLEALEGDQFKFNKHYFLDN